MNDFFSEYIKYTSGTEVPTFFNRWSIIVSVGAWIGKAVHFQHGPFKIYPNLYVMLLGAPGTKKSTAIKRAKKLIESAGYDTFAAEKITKEKFLLELSGDTSDRTDSNFDFLASAFNSNSSECFIAADEFNDFFGNNILDFVSLLGVLWDYDGIYRSKIKTGVSVEIPDPYISILGGNTQTTFANTFPPEVAGQGFFSRLIAVYAEPTKRRITFPLSPSTDDTAKLINHLYKIRETCSGEITITAEAKNLLNDIYTTWEPIDDSRFEYYQNRRLGHLIKLAMIHTVASLQMEITVDTLCYANTILAHTEYFMPRAFGEYGRAKNAGSTHKVLAMIESADGVIEFSTLWSKLSSDLNDLQQLGEILKGLVAADKIQATSTGFIIRRKELKILHTDKVDYRYLTPAEIEGV